MTSDEIKKVREAAESSSYLPSACIMDYVPIMRNFALSLVGTDGEDSVNEEWLREVWGFEKHGTGCYQVENFRLWFGVMSKLFCYGEGPVELNINGNVHRIATRYQFRLLAAALGIKRKGE